MNLKKRYHQLVKKYDIKSISKNLSDVYEDFKFNIPFFDTIIFTLTSIHKNKIMYYDEIQYWYKSVERYDIIKKYIDDFGYIVKSSIYENAYR